MNNKTLLDMQHVDQQLPTLLDVTCYVSLHTLQLGSCCSKFETGQTFS